MTMHSQSEEVKGTKGILSHAAQRKNLNIPVPTPDSHPGLDYFAPPELRIGKGSGHGKRPSSFHACFLREPMACAIADFTHGEHHRNLD